MEMSTESKIAILWHAQHAEDRHRWCCEAIAMEKNSIGGEVVRIFAGERPTQSEFASAARRFEELARKAAERDALQEASRAARALLGRVGLRGMLTWALTGEPIREATLAEIMRDVNMRENGEGSINEPPIFDVDTEMSGSDGKPCMARVSVYVDFSDRVW
jgi:hypothetical protein